MSRLKYNDIELFDIHTHEIAQEAVYSDDGVDYLYTKIVISCQAVVALELMPVTGEASAAEWLATWRHDLLIPRKKLEFFVGASLLVDSHPGVAADQFGSSTTPDAKNGPLPRSCNVKRIDGTSTVIVDYVIECNLFECGGPGLTGTGPDFSSHRFRESITIDENFYSTKTRTGKMIVRSNALGQAQIDTLRFQIVPAIPEGFKRERMEFAIQEDGLAMMYTIVDKEVYLQPPGPATKAEGEYIESTPRLGAVRYAECRVRLA